MPSRSGDNFARVLASSAVLLLLAAAEKVCPWLERPAPADVGEFAGGAPAAADREGPDSPTEPEKSAPLSLYAALPHATPAPRRAVESEQAGARITIGWHAGIRACGSRDSQTPIAAQLAPATWRWLEPLRPELRPARAPGSHPRSPADDVRRAIRRTGPPLA